MLDYKIPTDHLCLILKSSKVFLTKKGSLCLYIYKTLTFLTLKVDQSIISIIGADHSLVDIRSGPVSLQKFTARSAFICTYLRLSAIICIYLQNLPSYLSQEIICYEERDYLL